MGQASLAHVAEMLDRLAPVLLATAVRSTIILAAAAAVVLMMRRASAAARYWVWMLGFTGALLLPALSGALPSWRILPNPYASRVRLPSQTAMPIASPSVFQAEPATDGRPAVTVFTRARSEPATPGAADTLPAAVSSSSHASAAAPSALPSSHGHLHPSWMAWATLAWLIGSLCVSGYTLLGYLSLRSLRRRCVRIKEGELYDLLVRLCGRSRIRRPVELLSSPTRTMPMTWGVLRPRVLLPSQAADWPAEQRQSVMLHELGHVSRLDCLTQLLVQVAVAIYWFNPMIWIAGVRTQIERERACDDLVLNFGAEAASYAGHLLRTISTLPVSRLAASAVAMARPSTLEERLRAILDNGRNRRALSLRGMVMTIPVLLAGLIPVAMAQAQQAVSSDPQTDARPAVRPATRPAAASRAVRAGARPGPGGFGDSNPKPGAGPTCAFDATLYDVRMPPDQIGRLDVDALEQAAGNAESFEKALAALGEIKPLYRVDQSVRLSGENLTIGTQTPVATSTYVTANGHTVSNYSYQSTGAFFSIAGSAGAKGAIDLDLGIRLSSISDSGVAVSKSNKAPVIRSVTISHKGPVQPHKPFVVLSIDAGALDSSGKAVAYIGRITVAEPQAGPQPANER